MPRLLVTATFVIVAVAMVCGWAAIGFAQVANTDALELSVRKLVRDFNHSELAKREAAEQALLDLGPEVLELLPKADDRMAAETRHRLERVQQKLQQRAAENALQASTITLAGESLPLADVFAAFNAQTGNALVDQRGVFGAEVKPLHVDVAWQAERFWPALDELLDKTGLALDHFTAEEGLAVSPRFGQPAPRVGRAAYAGAFRVEAVRIEAIRDLRNPAGEKLQLELEIAWEPRLQPIAVSQSVSDLNAMDESGKPLPPAIEEAELLSEVHRGSTALRMHLPFELPPRGVQRIASLRGKLRALVPGRVQTFQFDGLEQAAKMEKSAAGVTVVIDSVRRNNEIWEVRMRVAFDKTFGALESHRGWIYNNECHVVGPDGAVIEPAGFETTRQTPNEIGLAYLFDLPDGPDGHAFVYKTPAAIMNAPIEYELKNIPLP